MLDLAMKRDMIELARPGGLRGGKARARALNPHRRSVIAKSAAQVRWKPKILVLKNPQDHAELQCFVAQYGNGYARAVDGCDPLAVLFHAAAACRDDACLARM